MDEKPHEVLYWRRGDDYAVRGGDWKLAWNDQGGPRTIRLFDLAGDPGEWKDLSAAEPARAQAMQDLFDAWDSRLADNQGGRNPRNRNSRYPSGGRVDVAEFNARVAAETPPERKPGGKGTATKGRTLEEQLAIAKAAARKKGKRFDAERATRWFEAKDLNGDGVLDEREQGTKAPQGWKDK